MFENIKILQLERLQATLNRVFKEVPFYHRLFESISFSPEDFSALEDIKKIPFTTKEHLRENYPYNFFAVPLREVVRIAATAGTTGIPIVVGYTKKDLQSLSEIAANALKYFEISKEDVIQITFHSGIFASAFGLQSGAEKIGASVIPVNFEDPSKQLRILQDYRTTVLVCTPSYALWLAEIFPRTEINVNSLFLKKIILCGSPFTEAQRKTIEQVFKVKVYNLYSNVEVFGPGIAYECPYGRLHFQEEYFLVEVINLETLEDAKVGEKGELVITTLNKEAFPLIRFRTGDVVILEDRKCPCGSSYFSTSSILGRKDEVIIVRGLKFTPDQIEKLLGEVLGDKPLYQIHLEKKAGLEEITILISLSERFFTDSYLEQKQWKKQIEEKLFLELSIPIEVKFVEKASLEKKNGEIPKIIDKR
ncbi:MAG: phenylacetate--CoA ligase family protein [Caldimicrobium sp.]